MAPWNTSFYLINARESRNTLGIFFIFNFKCLHYEVNYASNNCDGHQNIKQHQDKENLYDDPKYCQAQRNNYDKMHNTSLLYSTNHQKSIIINTFNRSNNTNDLPNYKSSKQPTNPFATVHDCQNDIHNQKANVNQERKSVTHDKFSLINHNKNNADKTRTTPNNVPR